VIIIGKNGKSAVNLDNISAVYIGANNVSVKCSFGQNSSISGCELGLYETEINACSAIRMMAECSGKPFYQMPTDEQVNTWRKTHSDIQEHDRGKDGAKPKRRGGS